LNLGTVLRSLPRTGLAAVSDQLVVGATQEELVLLDRAVVDALGSEARAIRHQAAFDASHALLHAIAGRVGVEGGGELLDLASELFSTLGLGQLRFELEATGGRAIAAESIHGTGQLARSGGPAATGPGLDVLAAGFAAAAASLAFPSDWGAFEGQELRCVGRGEPICEIELARRPVTERRGGALTRADAEQLLGPDAPTPPPPGAATTAARALLGGLAPDDAGRMRLGASRFTLFPAAYRAQLEFDTIHLLEKRPPPSGGPRQAPTSELLELFVELASESSRAGAFSLLGALYESPAMREATGPIPEDPGERAEQLCGIASVLGWGEIAVLELVPDLRLVLGVPLTPEAVYYAARHGGTPVSRLPGLRGLAEAIAWLAAWPGLGVTPIGRAAYLEQCRSAPALVTRETRSVLSGDPECEVVVELRPQG
jgi:hypothetical protein